MKMNEKNTRRHQNNLLGWEQTDPARERTLGQAIGSFLGRRALRSRAVLFLAAAVALLAIDSAASAANIPVPNGSFESPATTFADPRVDAWQKAPKPAWYDESGGFSWDQLVGQFLNTPPGTTNHIDNVDGNQALFLFAVPQVAIFQDHASTPTNSFDARFEASKAYQLTLAVVGGGGGMLEGTSLQLSLYYREGASNLVTVAATNITYTPAAFTNTTHLVDYSLTTPVVQPGDAWAGKNIGIQILSTVRPDQAGGYWDLDNVRLADVAGGPALSGASRSGGKFSFTLTSSPGAKFQIQASTNLASAPTGWTTVATITNLTGTAVFTDPGPELKQRFYRAQQTQ